MTWSGISVAKEDTGSARDSELLPPQIMRPMPRYGRLNEHGLHIKSYVDPDFRFAHLLITLGMCQTP